MKKVTFKFAPGEIVTIFHQDQIVEGKVDNVKYEENSSGDKTTYKLDLGNGKQIFKNEEFCFNDKQELIASL